ncbi:copper resistance protein CopC [Metabacillus lacus]|uniref:copper resistance protein CopC n=1 Tax=Metabacillus lacus TaxID=1983721 RepID=UPI0012AFC2A5
MKRLVFFILAAVLLLPGQAFAHTHLKDASPQDGETIIEPISEVELIFDTNIENLSTMTLNLGEEEIELDQRIENEVLAGTASAPLENGNYTLSWDIIGADGHQMQDSISFTVDAEQPEAAVEETAPEEQLPAAEDEEVVQEDEEEAMSGGTASEEAEGGSVSWIVIMVIGIVVLLSAGLLLSKKGK